MLKKANLLTRPTWRAARLISPKSKTRLVPARPQREANMILPSLLVLSSGMGADGSSTARSFLTRPPRARRDALLSQASTVDLQKEFSLAR